MKKTLYHGTQKQHVADILKDGFLQSDDAGWYQLSDSIESALFHCSSMEKNPKFVYVIEFTITTTNEYWDGYPLLWPPYNSESEYTWFSVKEQLNKKSVSAVYKVPYEEFLTQKRIGYDKHPKNIVSISENILSKTMTYNFESEASVV